MTGGQMVLKIVRDEYLRIYLGMAEVSGWSMIYWSMIPDGF